MEISSLPGCPVVMMVCLKKFMNIYNRSVVTVNINILKGRKYAKLRR